MGYFGEAVRLFGRAPRLWRYVVQPLVASMGVFAVLAVLAYFVLLNPVRAGLARVGLPTEASTTLGTFVVVGAVLVVGAFLYIAVTTFLSSLLWDRLSSEVEREIGVAVTDRTPPFAVVMADSVRRTLFALVMSLVGLCLASIPVVGPLLVTGLLGTLDYTGPAYVRRGILFREQRRRVFRLPGVAGFYGVAGVVALVPFVNLLFLPFLVTAGTIMVAKGEGNS